MWEIKVCLRVRYSFPFLGRRSWTSTAPALLAYKTKSPIIVATTKRKKGKYYIRYSPAIWPDTNKPLETEIIHLMNQSLSILEKSIQETPEQWLWQHNRWKQQTPHHVYKQYRHDSIAIIMPKENEQFLSLYKHLPLLKQIYPKNFLFLFLPKQFSSMKTFTVEEKIIYKQLEDLFVEDYRYKMVFNFTEDKALSRHYLRHSAICVLTFKGLQKIAKNHYPTCCISNIADVFLSALCRKKTFIKE